ncbi:hypothetical protein QVD99_007163 [Batrachochytrium dendrobatidis]|nr:hypothetical protein O5D80_007561 [Batrachochytrium dendrobatidis]KAK5666408.1 hypothetical protein QVD99_007163 [Batrachochytrium dendrobatidis]
MDCRSLSGSSLHSNTATIQLEFTAVVVDTNFLISQLSLLKQSVNHMSDDMFLFIPEVVVQELDGLKFNHSKDTLIHDDALERIKLSLGDCARQAIQFLFNALSDFSNNKVRGQVKSNVSTLYGSDIVNDDLILQCCLQCVPETASKVVLLSNDKNLCVKALIHGIPTISDFKGNSQALVNEIQHQASKYKQQSKTNLSNHNSHSSLNQTSIQQHTTSIHSTHLHAFSIEPSNHMQQDQTHMMDEDVMMDMDDMETEPIVVSSHVADLKTYPVPASISSALIHTEQKTLLALAQLETDWMACMMACIPVILYKKYGDEWAVISQVTPPKEMEQVIQLIDKLWEQVFCSVLDRNLFKQLGLNQRTAKDIRRSVRTNKLLLTRGDLTVFLQDMEQIARECCRWCGLTEDMERMKQLIWNIKIIVVDST